MSCAGFHGAGKALNGERPEHPRNARPLRAAPHGPSHGRRQRRTPLLQLKGPCCPGACARRWVETGSPRPWARWSWSPTGGAGATMCVLLFPAILVRVTVNDSGRTKHRGGGVRRPADPSASWWWMAGTLGTFRQQMTELPPSLTPAASSVRLQEGEDSTSLRPEPPQRWTSSSVQFWSLLQVILAVGPLLDWVPGLALPQMLAG